MNESPPNLSRGRRLLTGALALTIATILWLPEIGRAHV